MTRLLPANEVQTAILAALKADDELTAITARIYPPQAPNNPLRPFVLYGSAITTPRKVDDGDCADVSVAIHAFTASSTTVPDGRGQANTIAAHIARVLDEMDVEIEPDGTTVKVYVQQAQIMQDGDASAWHSFVTVRAEVS